MASALSSFYEACRSGDTESVRKLLKTMSLSDVDKSEPNGSTALHAACYYGHADVVKLLLERGACRSKKNKHNATPYDEASDEIKKLFLRAQTERFHNEPSEDVGWMKCDSEAEKIASDFRFRHIGFGWSEKNTIHRVSHIKGDMSSTDNERIETFLSQAQTDPTYLLRAYSAESDFYRNLNKDLAKKHFSEGSNFGLTYFIDFFYNHPQFNSLSYRGDSYRGMTITRDDLKEYQLGNTIMNKAFLSTSVSKAIAVSFAKKVPTRKTTDDVALKLSVLCKFTLVNHRSGLLIADVSEYKNESEVLVGPYTAFLIKDIRFISPTYVEIDLEECKMKSEENPSDDDEDL